MNRSERRLTSAMVGMPSAMNCPRLLGCVRNPANMPDGMICLSAAINWPWVDRNRADVGLMSAMSIEIAAARAVRCARVRRHVIEGWAAQSATATPRYVKPSIDGMVWA